MITKTTASKQRIFFFLKKSSQVFSNSHTKEEIITQVLKMD